MAAEAAEARQLNLVEAAKVEVGLGGVEGMITIAKAKMNSYNLTAVVLAFSWACSLMK